MVWQIASNIDEPRALTQAVLQVIDLLDLFQAELARVLQLRCADIGALASAQRSLEPGTRAWEQALLFVRFYCALYDRMDGNGVAMRHWLRVANRELGGVPHLLIVDDDRLPEVVKYLETPAQM
ncbi:MAG: XRE family transcriptional regulator [Gammaproteobacteria bacterium]